MQYIKKISIILLIWFVICSVGVSAQSIEKYTFSYYSSFLNTVLIPEIEEYILSLDLLPYSEEKGKKAINGIIIIIKRHASMMNIIVPPGKTYPVTLVGIPPDENGLVVYYINVVIPLLEYSDIGKITSVLIISKNFFCIKNIILKKEKV